MEAVPFHVGVATDDLVTSMRDLGEALGVTWTEPSCAGRLFHGVDGKPQPQPVSCISRQGPIHIDLMRGEPGTIWEAGQPRLHHFAYWTDDLRGDIARLGGDGWHLELTLPDAEGRPSVFAYLVRGDGFRLELIDDAGREAYTERLR
jgi:catechol 2,3-dioxygenase-like lactoylglutathione lyase family enzyme